MSTIDDALKANRLYARRHDPKLAQRPAPKIAVVTCRGSLNFDCDGAVGTAGGAELIRCVSEFTLTLNFPRSRAYIA